MFLTIRNYCITAILITLVLFASYSIAVANETAKHFILSLKANNQATRIQNSASGRLDEIMKYRRQALDHAKRTDRTALNKQLRGLGDKYYDLLVTGLTLQIEGYKNRDNVKLIRGQTLVMKWGEWYTRNINRIRKGK